MFSATDHLSYQPNTRLTSLKKKTNSTNSNSTNSHSKKDSESDSGMKWNQKVQSKLEMKMVEREEAYRFVGRLMGKAMLDEQMIGCYFNIPIWKHILGHPINFEDLALVDETLYQTLTWMLTHDKVEELDVYFAIDEVIQEEEEEEVGTTQSIGKKSDNGDIEMTNKQNVNNEKSKAKDEKRGNKTNDLSSSRKTCIVTRELIPGGSSILVTDMNKKQFVELRFRDTMLDKPREAIGSLLQGLYEIIPFPLISVFNPSELELLICGMSKVDVDDWKAHTLYVGGCKTHTPLMKKLSTLYINTVCWF